MVLGFKTHINGQPTFFVHEILASIYIAFSVDF